MGTFYIIISIIGVLSLVWIALILTFIWAEHSPLLRVFDHIDKTAKGINADINKNNEDIHKRWREVIENKDGIQYTQYPQWGSYKEGVMNFKATMDVPPLFKHERVKYSSGLVQPCTCTKKPAPKRTKKAAKKTVKKPAKLAKK